MAHYFDHAATTPMHPDVLAAMMPYFVAEAGNPSSLHAAGRRARRAVEESREAIAAALGARPSEVLFTGGGTEADNLAVKGLFWARRDENPRRTRIVASAVEHHAVLDAIGWLEGHEQAQVTWLPVDADGRVSADDLAVALETDDVALVSVMWANNEVGTVQPIGELADLTRDAGVPMHTDAVQAIPTLDVDFGASGVDALAISAHKVAGPKGVGALLLRTGQTCTPLLHGGGQERDVRSGTLDTAGVVGLAAAVQRAAEHRVDEAARLAALRDRLVSGVLSAVPDAALNGAADERLPGNANVAFPGCEGDALLLLLDARGIECSTGSACTAGVAQPSHVLLAMGRTPEVARSALRFSLGHTSTSDDVDAVLDVIASVVDRARRAGLTSPQR